MTSTARPLRVTRRRPRRDTDGNAALTTGTGALLIVLLAPLGVTILRIGQLTWLHLFLGILLIGPVALKLASTGYRFARYYTHDSDYTRKGPPALILRLLAPLLVFSTLGVLLSGVVLLLEGPATRGTWMLLHKATFIMWLGLTAIHLFGHLPELGRLFGRRVDLTEVVGPDLVGFIQSDQEDPITLGGRGGPGRLLALAGSIALGLLLVLVLLPDFSAWTHFAALRQLFSH